MDKPFFYFGSAYLWTLMLIALTADGVAWVFLAGSLLACPVLLVRLRTQRTGTEKRKFFLLCVLVIAAAAAAFLLQLHLVYRPALAQAGEEVVLDGYVTEVLNDSMTGAHRCVLRTLDGEPVRQVRFSSTHYRPAVGDSFRVKATLRALGEQSAEVQRYYRSRGLYLSASTTGRVDAVPLTERIAAGDIAWSPFREAAVRLVLRIGQVREDMEAVVEEWLPQEYAAVLNGMLVGDTEGIASGTRDTFRRSGVMHLFAVSGFHTSLWAMLLFHFLLRCGAGRKTSSGLTILFLLFFVVLTGFARSAVRAAVMMGVFFLSRLILRSPDPLGSLGVAVLCVVAPNPFYGGDAGVLLSYFATLGILSLYPPVMKEVRDRFLKERIHDYRRRKRLDSAISLLVIAGSTFVMTLPVVALTFENVSLLNLVSNLLLTGAASAAIFLTGAGSVFGLVPGLSLLTPWCGLAAGTLARYILKVCETLSALPFAYVTLTGKGFLLGLGAALLVTTAGFVLYGSLQDPGLVRMTALLSVIVLLGSVLADTAMNRNVTKVFFSDVEGTCIVVTHRHAAWLIGAGGDEYGTPLQVDDIFSRESVSTLPAIVVPRDKKTEAGALEALLEDREPGLLVRPEDLPDAPVQTVRLAPEITLELYRQDGDDCAGLLTVQDVDLLLLFRPTVDLDRLPEDALRAPIVFLRGNRPEHLKLPSSSYIIVSGETGEIETRVRSGTFRLYRARIAAAK